MFREVIMGFEIPQLVGNQMSWIKGPSESQQFTAAFQLHDSEPNLQFLIVLQ